MASTQKNTELIEQARSLNHVPWGDHYEKMISGMLSNPDAPKLVEARHRARVTNTEYNDFPVQTVTAQKLREVKHSLMQRVVGKIGEGSQIEAPFHADYGCNISIGKDSIANFNMVILDTSLVTIGDRVQIGPNLHIYTVNHDVSVLSRRKYVEFGHPVTIEDDCWIGGNVTILPGVTVGQGSTVGAGSLVTKSIPPFSVALGSPARVVRKVPSAEEEEQDPSN
ncbi:hypothetical protein FE257_013034 [Aspergillus nanangensis]|uniref:Maltose/galactoside acetyltransferase domain-containing protein n=1 Tax=Aspergillus nanangensis TaxID=2582783 RepID=A0AAD4CGN6_ASPNN|nr:hypothetical protein FE257_013034 [Aspergillus nanangensis]